MMQNEYISQIRRLLSLKIIPTTYYQNTNLYHQLLAEYYRLGIDTLRINCTRANVDAYIYEISMLKRKFKEINGMNPHILMDLPIPKTKPRITFSRPVAKERIAFNNGGDEDYYLIHKNELLTISTEHEENTELSFKISSDQFLNQLRIGDEVIIGEASLTIRLIKKMKHSYVFIAVCDGYISYGKYVYSKKCKTIFEDHYTKFIPLVNHVKPDFIALSFVESKRDVEQFKSAYNIEDDIKIISKIETLNGCRNLKEIAKCSDVIMIARGDLYTHTNYQQFSIACEKILQFQQKPVFAATGFLQTIHSSQDEPLRSEIIDLFFHMKYAQGIVLAYTQSQDKEVINHCVSIINQIKI